MSANRLHLDAPPHDETFEQQIIGSVFHDNKLMDELGGLKPEHFYSPRHQDIFFAMQTLQSHRLPIDAATVRDVMKKSGKEQDGEIVEYLRQLKADVFVTATIAYHARKVIEYATRRKYVNTLRDLMVEAANPTDPDNLSDLIEQKVLAIRDVGDTTKPKAFSECLYAVADRIEDKLANKFIGIDTPWEMLNVITGMRPGELIVAAARTSVGKSILGTMLATHAARHGQGVLVSSVEMEGIDIAARVISAEGSICAQVTTGRVDATEDEVESIHRQIAALRDVPIHILDSGSQSVSSITASARRLKRAGKLGMVVVDYLQLLEAPRSHGQTRAEVLGEVSKGLKQLAKELQIPIVALCQLNREAESQPEPLLSHLRESGAIEQDADQVWLFWRPSPGIIHLKVEKNRSGPTGRITLKHRQEFMRFESE